MSSSISTLVSPPCFHSIHWRRLPHLGPLTCNAQQLVLDLLVIHFSFAKTNPLTASGGT